MYRCKIMLASTTDNRQVQQSPGVCPSKGAAVGTFTVTSDYDVANQPFQIFLTL